MLFRSRKYYPDFNEEIFAHAITGEWDGHDAYYIVLNFNHHFSKICSGTIAHEAFHIASYIAENRGVKMDFNNPEPMAYLVGWIDNEVNKFARKHNYL